MQDAVDADERARWCQHFGDFVRFSLVLNANDGAQFVAHSGYRDATRREFRKYLRGEPEIRKLRGDKVLAEPRFNPDGTIDILRWSRPQYDGPALRALACMRYLGAGGQTSDELVQLLNGDLQFTVRHAGRRCIGPWEEVGQNTHHYYVALVQLGALEHGRSFAGHLEPEWIAAATRLRRTLERHWSERHQVYSATWPAHGETADDLVDAATLIAVLDADLPTGAHSVQDLRVHRTQAAIEDLFARLLPINQGRRAGHAPALGRWRDDRYFGGGAWYPTTLAAATLCYRRAQSPGEDAAMLVRRGDAFMATVRGLTPADGALSEQVDRATGAQVSARHLAWSYAAFLVAARTRRQALRLVRRED
jgi:glucoamylase